MTPSFWEFVEHKKDFEGAGYLEIRPDWRERLPREVSPSGRWMQNCLRESGSVLDVGAGDRRYREVLRDLGLNPAYLSADTDLAWGAHDYADFMAISDRFDGILMFELIEHIDFELAIAFMRHARTLLNPGGVLLVSTPNAHHPNQIWRASVTHIRPWPADDLYGALRYSGFGRVRVLRQYLASPRRRLVKPLTKALYRLMELDHAQGLLAAAWAD